MRPSTESPVKEAVRCSDSFPLSLIDSDIFNTDQEYTILRSEAVVHVPSEVDPAAYAPILCAGVTVFNSMRHMNIPSGEVVGIQGLGGLGHLALQYAARMGFRVVALSSSGSKEKFARELGAMEYIDSSKESQHEGLQKLGGAAMIVCTAPNPEIMGDLLNGLAPFGKLLLLARELPSAPRWRCPSHKRA